MVKWHAKAAMNAAGKKVREAAAPFIMWLEVAEEESSADEADAARASDASELAALKLERKAAQAIAAVELGGGAADDCPEWQGSDSLPTSVLA